MIFESQNVRYNRLDDQISQCSFLMIQITVGYIFALMAIDSLSLFDIAYSVVIVGITILLIINHLNRLDAKRVQTRRVLDRLMGGLTPNI